MYLPWSLRLILEPTIRSLTVLDTSTLLSIACAVMHAAVFVYCNTRDLSTAKLYFARVKTCTNFNSEFTDTIANTTCTTHRTGRSIKGRKESVTGDIPQLSTKKPDHPLAPHCPDCGGELLFLKSILPFHRERSDSG
jgi:hypothetical protein